MTDLRDFEKNLRATLADVADAAGEPPGLADRLVTGVTRGRVPHRTRGWLHSRWLPPALAAAVVAAVTVATVTTVSSLQSHRPTRPAHPTPAPTSTQPPSPTPSLPPTSSAPSPSTSAQPTPRGHVTVTARDWDIDGDGRPEYPRLVNVGGDSWQLIVDMTRLGRQTVPFTSKSPPGGIGAPVQSVDADHDGYAEVFVADGLGASTESWMIFKLDGRQLVQVTAGSQPVALKAGGTVTHMDGFQCVGSALITTSETTGPPDYKIVSYLRTTYAWHGARLQQVSQHAGTFTGTPDVGVACGDLGRQPPSQPSASLSPTPHTTSAPAAASGPWTGSPLIITDHSLGAVSRGMSLAQAEAAAGTSLSMIGDGIFRPTDGTITGSTVLQFSWGVTCFDAHRSTSRPGTTVATSAGVRIGGPMSQISTAYGSQATPFTADPTWTGAGNIPSGIIVQQGDGVLLFVGSTPDGRGGTITSVRGAADAFHARSVFC